MNSSPLTTIWRSAILGGLIGITWTLIQVVNKLYEIEINTRALMLLGGQK